MRTVLIVSLVSLLIPLSFGEDLDVLPEKIGDMETTSMITQYWRNLTYEAFDERNQAYEEMKTEEDIQNYQKKMKDFFYEKIDGKPPQTPLNAKVTEKQEFEDYRIEKVIYESHPHVYVTAILYLPKTEPPYPGVLFPCGHSGNGKGAETYQRGCILLAKNGFAVLSYDPVDQGERYQLLDEENEPIIGGTTGHTMMGVGSILVGRNTASYRIWDGMRGIDYLLTRDEIDKDRIGCTGNSGGGTLTSYIMALDERVDCAAPSCYITTLKDQEPQDAEQDIHGQIAFGMDHADYIMMRAPKPTLLCTATHDFFDIEGSWFAFRQAKRFYTRMGYAERVDLIETDAQHGFSKQLREGMVRWMSRWLKGEDKVIFEPDFSILNDEEILCTEEGQVVLMDDARTVYDLNLELEKELANKREHLWKNESQQTLREKIRDIASIRQADDLPELEVEKKGSLERDGYTIRKLILKPEPNIMLPALFFTPNESTKDAVLYLHGEGKNAEAKEGGAIESLLNNGHTVLAVDMRGIGEIRETSNRGAMVKYFGQEWRNFFSAYMLDKSYLGLRAEDAIQCARYLQDHPENSSGVQIIGIGEMGPAVLHAAALEPDLFSKITLKQSLGSWSNVIHSTITENQLINAIHGALKVYDLPDLVSLLPKDKVQIVEPVDAVGNPL